MKKSCHKGLTLIEIVISFLLISFIIVMVSNAITSSYVLSTKIKDLPNAYYKTQVTAETKISEIKELIAEKAKIKNDIDNTPNDKVSEELKKRLEEIEKQIDDMEQDTEDPLYKKTITLFGKQAEVYEFEHKYADSAKNFDTNLYVGLANVEPLERLAPIIKDVKITVNGEDKENIFDAVGKKATVTQVNYDSKNSHLKKKELYRWYITTENFHMLPDKALTDKQIEQLGNKVMPQYASSFTPISDKEGGNSNSITIKDEYKGKFLVCVVSNVSVNGKISKAVASNFLYINSLPKLEAEAKYTMWIEPTLMKNTYTDNGTIELSQIESEEAYGEKLPIRLAAKDSNKLKINLNGIKTNSHNHEGGSQSRYLMFSAGEKAVLTTTGDATSLGEDTVVYLVANIKGENDNGASSDILKVNDQVVELETKLGQNGDTGWKVLSAKLLNHSNKPDKHDESGKLDVLDTSDKSDISDLENLSNIILGSDTKDIEIAEIILTSKASEDEVEKIIKYLGEKYYIHN